MLLILSYSIHSPSSLKVMVSMPLISSCVKLIWIFLAQASIALVIISSIACSGLIDFISFTIVS